MTVKQFKNGGLLPPPIYKEKPYVILNDDNVVLYAGTLKEIKSNLIVFSDYYDDCTIDARSHDLYLTDNEKEDQSEKSAEVIVVVDGGIVQMVFSDTLNVNVEILDNDNYRDSACSEEEKADYRELEKKTEMMHQVY